MRYNFCSWWNGSNPFPIEITKFLPHIFGFHIENWETKECIVFDFQKEESLIKFVNQAEAAIASKGLKIVWADHGTQSKEGEVIFCAQQIDVTLWKKKE